MRVNRCKQEREVDYQGGQLSPFQIATGKSISLQFEPSPSPSRNTVIAFERRHGELVGKQVHGADAQ